MLRVLLTPIGIVLLTLPIDSVGSEDSCPVEGITGRWAMSYCMTRFETDDEANPGVSECFLKELQERIANGPEEDCDVNLAYKAAICSILIEWKTYEESLASCVSSEEMVPSVVKSGIG